MSSLQFSQVSLNALATVSDDGRHIQRTLSFADGHQKILGCLLGAWADSTQTFVIKVNGNCAERIEITQGECQVQLGNAENGEQYREGQSFVVSSGTRLTISTQGLVQYIRHLEG